MIPDNAETTTTAKRSTAKSAGLAVPEQTEQTSSLSVSAANREGFELAKRETMARLDGYTRASRKLASMEENAMERIRSERFDSLNRGAEDVAPVGEDFFTECEQELESLLAPAT